MDNMQNFTRLKLGQTKTHLWGHLCLFPSRMFVWISYPPRTQKNGCLFLRWLLSVFLALSKASSTCCRTQIQFRKNNFTVLSSWPAMRVRGIRHSARVRSASHSPTTHPQVGHLLEPSLLGLICERFPERNTQFSFFWQENLMNLPVNRASPSPSHWPAHANANQS